MSRTAAAAAALAMSALGAVSASPIQNRPALDLGALLERVGQSVARYYERAQSIICDESVRIQSLGPDLMGDRTSPRRLDYELRVAWGGEAGGEMQEATVFRQLMKVNGRAARPKDEPECLDPKSVSPDSLGMLLPASQKDYIFTLKGPARVDGREAVTIDYRSRTPGPVGISVNKDCMSIDLPGRMAGRIWVDQETGDVLRFDERLASMVDVTWPRDKRRADMPLTVTVERVDSSVRYRAVRFSDPEEIVMLPVTIDSLVILRNSGIPRRRTTQAFSNYRRFMTDGRIVQ